MPTMENDIKDRLARVRTRLEAARIRAGRAPGDVRLVAVGKTQPVEAIRAALEAGVEIIGENYIQEAIDKIEILGRPCAWHFIGRLQTNKAKYAARLFDMIHSVDNLKLARELDKKAEAAGRRPAVLVQVNLSGEETKGGTTNEDAARLAEAVGRLKNLTLSGFMTMPPFFDQPDKARPFFAALRELRDKIGEASWELSMGMSGDFETAIEEGATLVRVGTAIFGARS
ncbi:MAG: YggS family pyridoxal phosphate-dependent enzyme [Pseudomonadota bacterium]